MLKISKTGCIFCKIASGEIPSAGFWENDGFLAILDKFPNTKGQTLIISKKHLPSNILKLDDEIFTNFMLAAKTVSAILTKGLKVGRVGLVIEGMGIDHAHVKLYPMHGVGAEFSEMWGDHRVYFDKYTGYLTTLTGPEAEMEELNRIAGTLKSAGI